MEPVGISPRVMLKRAGAQDEGASHTPGGVNAGLPSWSAGLRHVRDMAKPRCGTRRTPGDESYGMGSPKCVGEETGRSGGYQTHAEEVGRRECGSVGCVRAAAKESLAERCRLSCRRVGVERGGGAGERPRGKTV